MNSLEAFQICPSHARPNQRKKRNEYCGLTGARSLRLFTFRHWRGLGFAAAAMRRSLLVRNILADL